MTSNIKTRLEENDFTHIHTTGNIVNCQTMKSRALNIKIMLISRAKNKKHLFCLPNAQVWMQMQSQSFSAAAGSGISQTALKAAAVQTVSDETLSFPLLPVERGRMGGSQTSDSISLFCESARDPSSPSTWNIHNMTICWSNEISPHPVG